MPAPHIALGRRGEDIAARYLETTGLVVLDRNWRCHAGELDIVCADGTGLVVCEVKTRSGTDFGTPAEAVDDAKAARIRDLAAHWRRDHGVRPCPVRFDIVAVLLRPDAAAEVRHLRGALESEPGDLRARMILYGVFLRADRRNAAAEDLAPEDGAPTPPHAADPAHEPLSGAAPFPPSAPYAANP